MIKTNSIAMTTKPVLVLLFPHLADHSKNYVLINLPEVFYPSRGKNSYSQTLFILTQEAVMANTGIDNNAVVMELNKILRPQTDKS